MTTEPALSLATADSIRLYLHRCYDGRIGPTGRQTSAAPSGAFSAWLLRAGTVRVHLANRRPLIARAGQWLINSPSLPRRQVFSAAARLLSVHFVADVAALRPLFDAGLPVVFPARAHPDLEAAGRRCVGVVDRVRASSGTPEYDPITRLRFPLPDWCELQAALTEFVGCLARALMAQGIAPDLHVSADSRVALIQSALVQSGFTGDTPYSQLLRLTGLSQRQMDRLFAAECALTPKAYRTRLRLRQATLLLREYGSSVKQVAYTLKFRDPSHFVASFRRQTGATPREFVRHHH